MSDAQPDLIEKYFNEHIRKSVDGVCVSLIRKMVKSPSTKKLVIFFLYGLRRGRREFTMNELRGLVESPSNFSFKLSFFITYNLVVIRRVHPNSRVSSVYLTEDFMKIKDRLEEHVNGLLGDKHE